MLRGPPCRFSTSNAPLRVERSQIDGDFLHIGVAFENTHEALLDQDIDPQIRPVRLQESQRRRGEHAIAQRAQTDHVDARALGKGFQQ